MTELKVERGDKRIRAYKDGRPAADTTRPLLVWERPFYPTYWFPEDDVARPDLGELRTLDGHDEKYVRFDWAAIDNWFEEDEEVYVHARNPYTRIDILASSRHVRVERDGVVLADSVHTRALFETGLVVRWYFPKVDVRMELLEPTDTITQCPYKGQAEYWSARIGDRLVPDLAWSYPSPLPESQKIAGLVAFYNERVDLHLTPPNSTK